MFVHYDENGNFADLLSIDDRDYADWRFQQKGLKGEVREISHSEYDKICSDVAYNRACINAAKTFAA